MSLVYKISGSGNKLQFKKSNDTSFSPDDRTMDSKPSQKGNKENTSSNIPKDLVSSQETAKMSNLQFDKLQPPKEACREDRRLDFGNFTAREAVLDEEYWVSCNDQTSVYIVHENIILSFNS